jgi:hypothetical protein
MADGPTFISAIVGFGIVIVAGFMLGGGSHSLTGLFAAQGTRDWPIGVQEPDAPHFLFDHTSERTPSSSGGDDDLDAAPSWAAIEELYAGPLR